MNVFLGILGVIFIILMVILFLVSFLLKKSLNSLYIEHQPHEIKLGTGKKSAIIIYQPTRHNTATNVTMALAEALVANDYTVTVNFPSHNLNYNLASYDLIAFGSGVYMGRVSTTLIDYMYQNKFIDKKVFLYTVGQRLKDTSDLSELKVQLNSKNDVHEIKVKKGQEACIKRFVDEALKD